MSDELKIKKERVLEIAESCEQANSILKKLFPEVFEEKEADDITEEIEWKLYKGTSGYWMNGFYRGEHVCYLDGVDIFGVYPLKIRIEKQHKFTAGFIIRKLDGNPK